MRIFSYLIVLLGLLFVTHNILAQQMWYDRPAIPPIDKSYIEAIGVVQSEAIFVGSLMNQRTVHIGDFYSAGGRASHQVEQLNIDRFWVTSNRLGEVKDYNTNATKHGSVVIKKYILQVGVRSINVAGTRSFGIDQEVLSSVSLTDIFVSGGAKTDMKGNGKSPSNWGLLGNFGVENYGTIISADVSGGTFGNAGEVKELKYSGGTYQDNGGHIETLSLAARSEKQSWGKVDTLMFDSEGNGLITLTGFVDNGKLDFLGIDVQRKVDFANGKIELDVTKVVNDLLVTSSALSYRLDEDKDWAAGLRNAFGNEAFTVAKIFGDISFAGVSEMNIAMIRRTEHATEPDREVIVRAGEVQENWRTEGMQTPEPATLAVLGLGLAGLGLASRRRKQ